MPTVTGAWNPSSGANFRWRLLVDYSVSTPSPGQTSVTVSGAVRVQVGYGIQWNGASFSWSGTLLGSGSASKNVHVSTGGTIQIHTFSTSVAIGTSASSKSVTFSLWGVNLGNLGTARVTANIPIPARVAVPVPTNVSVTRVSTSRLRVTWDGGPVHGVRVRRRSVAGAASGTWNDFETIGTDGVSRSTGYEINVVPGYEWEAAVRRQAGGVWSSYGYSHNSARLFDAPNAPTSLVAEHIHDSRHILEWVNNTVASGRATHLELHRWTWLSGSWTNVATLGSGAQSYVDTRLLDNNEVEWRVRAVNAAGASGWVWSNRVFTVPTAATSVVASRTGPAAASVSWTITARRASSQGIEAQTSTDLGVSWSAWAPLAGHENFSAAATSRAITGLDASRWYRFRVVSIAENTAPNPDLFAYSSGTEVIRPAAKPNPPELLAPSGVVSSAEPVAFRWRHNPTDGSQQTAYELRYRPNGGAWDTLSESSSADQTRDVDIPVPGVYEWQVRTRGQHVDWSEWAPVGAFEVLHPPAVTIESPTPEEGWPSNRATVTISYADATEAAMTGWRAELHALDGAGGGELVENRSGTGAVEKIRFDTVLNNFADYAVWVWATSGTGLESAPATVEFSTDFLPPATPTLVADWVEPDGLVRLTVENHPGDDTTTVDTVHNRVERSTDLGRTWVTLGDNMPLDVGLDDDMVPLGSIVWHRVVAVSSWDTEAASEIAELHTTSGRVWLTGEDGATLMVVANPTLDYSDGHERVSEQYYGRSKPTAHYGEGLPVTVGVSGDLLQGMGYGQDVARLLMQDVFYRDPYGRAFWASVTDGFSRRMDSGGHNRQSISFTVEQIHVEA